MRKDQILGELRGQSPVISVGLLTADLLSLGSEVALMEAAGVRLLHFDVMDGRFCPMMTVGPPFIKAVRTPLLKDVHLMVEAPSANIDGFVAAGAVMITVHAEAGRHVHRVLQAVGEAANANDPDRPILRGLGLNPGTPLEVVCPLLDEIEMVFLLAVNPGWRGQKFIAATERRLAEVRRITAAAGRDILIGVDGGVTKDNIGDVARMGADIIVTGSAVFDGKSPLENARFMIAAARDAAGGS